MTSLRLTLGYTLGAQKNGASTNSPFMKGEKFSEELFL